MSDLVITQFVDRPSTCRTPQPHEPRKTPKRDKMDATKAPPEGQSTGKYMLYSFLIGLILGAALFWWRAQSHLHKRRRIPKEWPLSLRPLVNSSEKRVWIWLTKVLFDQQILVKLPVTRFTTPAKQGEAAQWYRLLNGVYCTFTVCDLEGRVIGCVDVPSAKGLSISNQTLKHTLLSQCGLHYWVVDPANLPHLIQVRKAFLGEQSVKNSERERLETEFKDVQHHLKAVVTRQRHSHQGTDSDRPSGSASEPPESRLSSGWEQNSFVTPLDSRAAPLGTK